MSQGIQGVFPVSTKIRENLVFKWWILIGLILNLSVLHEGGVKNVWKKSKKLKKTIYFWTNIGPIHACCVFRPANRCSACRSLVEIIYFLSFFHVWRKKMKKTGLNSKVKFKRAFPFGKVMTNIKFERFSDRQK